MTRLGAAAYLILGIWVLATGPAYALEGWAVYASQGRAYRCTVGGTPEVLYEGGVAYTCWSVDGTRIFFMKSDGDIWAMGNDGAEPRRLASGKYTEQCPIATYRPDGRYVLCVDGGKFDAISAIDGSRTPIHSEARRYLGEIAISRDGTRLVARTFTHLYKILAGQVGEMYSPRCSSSISPNGRWMTRNSGDWRRTILYNWDGGIYKELRTPLGREWDEQRFAANSDEYVVYSFNDRQAIGVVHVSDGEHTIVGDLIADYPDFFIGPLPDPGE